MEARHLEDAMASAARVVRAGDPDQKNLFRIYLADEDGRAVVYATDAYHAIRVDTGRVAPKMDRPVGVTLNAKSKAPLSYDDLLDYSDDEYHMSRVIATMFDAGRDAARVYRPAVALPDERVSSFGYFDGERRKPQGLIDITFDAEGCDPDRIDVRFRRGLRVSGHATMHPSNTGIYWQSTEPEREVLGSLEVDTETRKRLADGDGSMYSAKLLWVLNGASAMGFVDTLKPLYLSSLGGDVEYVVMPITRAGGRA